MAKNISGNYSLVEGVDDSGSNEPDNMVCKMEPNLRYSKNNDFTAKRPPEKSNTRKEVGRNHIYV